MEECLARWVSCESPSRHPEALEAMASLLVGEFCQLDLRVRRTLGGQLLMVGPCGQQPGRQLLLGHFDTVWPPGSLASMPVRVEEGRLFGPGCYDMKAGICLILFALRCLQALRLSPAFQVVILLNNDEEVGSPDSGRWIHRLSPLCRRCYVLEPSLGPDGLLKTSRKGVASYTVDIAGRPAHAGLDPGAGASAILELSYIIQELHALNDSETGVSVNVGLVQGGVRPNVVAPESRAVVDVRVPTRNDLDRVDGHIRALQARVPGVRLTISGRSGRPPLEANPANQRLWKRAQHWGRELGLQLGQGQAGGGSDGSTASLYCPTLDGLGPVGAGAHARDEHVLLDSLPERCALLTLLLLDAEV